MNKPRKGQQAPKPQQAPEPEPVAAVEREIEPYRRCPVCWNGRGGYGVAYSTQGSVRYYKCCKSRKSEGLGPCGHTWSVRVHLETITIQHREVNIDGNR